MRHAPSSRHALRRLAWGRLAGAAVGTLVAGAIAGARPAQPVILYLLFGVSCGSALGGWLVRRR